MNTALIIHVGANLKENGGLSPIFKDHSYEYIPSPLDAAFNTSKHHNHKHYSNLNCQNPNLKDMHMSSFVDEGTGHVDPEFYTFTYGESRSQYISLLKKLKKDDLLLFAITLQKYDSKKENFVLNGEPSTYIFGYFQVQSIDEATGPLDETKVHDFQKTCNEHVIYKNHHIQTPENKKVLFVQGNKHDSAIFRTPLKIGEDNNFIAKFKKNWGISSKNEKLTAYWCLNYEKVKQDIFAHVENNRWVEWIIP